MNFRRKNMINKYKYLLKNKFNSDLIWNIGSFGIIAFCGLAINIIITTKYGFKELGQFNIIYVIYLLLSQISAWGIHLSVQKYIPQYYKNKKLSGEILTSAIVVSTIISILISAIVYIGHEIPGQIMQSAFLKISFIYSIPGLLFFTLNKTFLSFLNGIRQMKSYSIYNAIRPILMIVFLISLIYFNLNIKYISLIFTLPEFLLSLLLILNLKKHLIFPKTKKLIALCKIQFNHGSKVALGNIVLDLNSKIDILLLGVF